MTRKLLTCCQMERCRRYRFNEAEDERLPRSGNLPRSSGSSPSRVWMAVQPVHSGRAEKGNRDEPE